MKKFLFLAPIFFSLLFAQVFAEEQKVKLKDGPGRNLVETNCIVCHSLDYVIMNSPFLDREGWEKTIDKMVNVMGAPVNKSDIPQIIDYLTKYYGKRIKSYKNKTSGHK